MRDFLVVSSLVGAVISSLLLATARPAFACSAGPDFDPLADATLIVAGRISGWELEPPEAGMVAVRVTMTVERTYKGQPTAPLVFLDHGSQFAAEQAAVQYPGLSAGIGGCSIFEADDPTGRYAVLGLMRREDGALVANRLLTFFLGDAPHGPAYDQGIARLAAIGPARLPVTGTGGEAGSGTPSTTPSITVIPTLVPAGQPTTLTVQGTGFASHDTVLIEYFGKARFDAGIGGDTSRLAQTLVGPDGRFSATVSLPAMPVTDLLAFYVMAFPLSFQVRSTETLRQAPKAVFTVVPEVQLPLVGMGLAADERVDLRAVISASLVLVLVLGGVVWQAHARRHRSTQ
jgi:hypothetical protein